MSDMEDTKVKVGEKGNEEFVSLGALAGINMDDIKELRGFSFPKGDFIWEISTDSENLPRLAAVGEGEKAKPAIVIPCKCIDTIRVNDEEYTGEDQDLIGKVHRETIFLTGKIEEALGYFKGFVKDVGAPTAGDLQTLIAGLSGVRFQAPIQKRKNPNDHDIVYTQINRMKAKPIVGEAGSVVGQAATAA